MQSLKRVFDFMTSIITLDTNNGLLFNKRRLSQDKVVTADIISQASGTNLYVTPYSYKLFPEGTPCTPLNNPYTLADKQAVIFAEDINPVKYIDIIDTFVVYLWNKEYPSDVRFNVNLQELGFRVTNRVDFSSNTHPNITRLIFSRYV